MEGEGGRGGRGGEGEGKRRERKKDKKKGGGERRGEWRIIRELTFRLQYASLKNDLHLQKPFLFLHRISATEKKNLEDINEVPDTLTRSAWLS